MKILRIFGAASVLVLGMTLGVPMAVAQEKPASTAAADVAPADEASEIIITGTRRPTAR